MEQHVIFEQMQCWWMGGASMVPELVQLLSGAKKQVTPTAIFAGAQSIKAGMSINFQNTFR